VESQGTRTKTGAGATRNAGSARTAWLSMLCTRSATSRTTDELGRTAGASARCCAQSPSNVIESTSRRSQNARRTTARRTGIVVEMLWLTVTPDTKHIRFRRANREAFCALAARGRGRTLTPMARETPRGLLLIGALKLLKGLALLLLGVGLLSMLHRDAAAVVRHWLQFFRLDVHARLLEAMLAKIAGINHQTMRRLGVGTLVYSAVFGIEGVGLLRGKAWAEYMTIAVTVSFLPIEAYELMAHPSAMKALVTLINVAVVIYLVFEIRRRRTNEQLRPGTPAPQPSQ